MPVSHPSSPPAASQGPGPLGQTEKAPVVPPAQAEKTADFRKVFWGMSRDQVKALEPSKLSSEKEGTLIYHADLPEFGKVVIGYSFAEGKLVIAVYVSEEKHTNANLYIDDYDKIKGILTAKYGKPDADELLWKNELFKDQPDHWGMAVSAGHLLYQARWKTKTTEILEKLQGDNYDVNLLVKYSSIKLSGLYDAKTREEQKSDF
jgi:hypothetical protein